MSKAARSPRRTLIVTNDFPPRQGGIQSFVHQLAVRQPPGSVVVYASRHPGWQAFDAAQPFPVIRQPTGMLLPTPATRRGVVAALRDNDCTAVWFGASAPLGLLAAPLRHAGAERIVATTHGHEVGWAMLPAGRQALRRIGNTCDVVTYLGEYTRRRLAPAFGPHAELSRLTPGVDVAAFHPGLGDAAAALRERYRLGSRPAIVCVSRLVPRKGQDMLIAALPEIRAALGEVMLLLVGDGRYRAALAEQARRAAVSEQVIFTGPVAQDQLAAHYAVGDVFAMPCRTRRLGMDVEGLGIVYLEASAVGLPVLAGESGGAPDAVLAGRTGVVVDGRDRGEVAAALITLLGDREERARLGARGRAWVERDWRWEVLAARLGALLQG